MAEILETLASREKTHGRFSSHAAISQKLKEDMKCPGWGRLNDSQIEALEMIAHKIARILNGDPNTHDHWHDIAGYATLVANELEAK